MISYVCENKQFLFRQYSSKEVFVKEYKNTIHGEEEAKELYLLLLNELKKAVSEGKIEHVKKLSHTFNFINDLEKRDALKTYYDSTVNPIKSTNFVILACQHNKLNILKFLLANDTILKNLSVNAGRNITAEDEDESRHNSFYYALSSGNVELTNTLINNSLDNYFAADSVDLDDILSRTYEELKLKNVPLSTEIEIFVETKLLNLRFFSNSRKPCSMVKDYEHNIRERVRLVLENITLLKTEYLQAKEIDERFLHIARFIAQNIHVLKRRLKSTYNRLPWEEIEFCLISFVSSHIKEQEINLFSNALLSKNNILNYLDFFSRKLEDIIRTEDIGKLTDLPKFKREKIVAEIKKNSPQFEDLYKVHQRIRDIHSLQKINDYVKLALLVDPKEREGQIIITRVLQVIGEYLKNTLESPKLSNETSAFLLFLLPKNTKEIIIDLRNSLSHAYSLNKRTEIEESADVNFFIGIQNDTKKVGDAIIDILHKHKMKIIRMFLKQIFNSENLDEMKEITKKLSKLELDPIDPVYFKMLEHQKLEKLVEELNSIVPQKTPNVQYLFHKIGKILIDFEKNNANKNLDYVMGYASLITFNITLNDDKIDKYFITGMKCRACKTLIDITTRLDPDYLEEIAELTRDIFHSVKSKIHENKRERLSSIMWEIFYIIEFEVGNIRWIEELREKINEKCFQIPACKKNNMIDEKYNSRLEIKLAELKSILSRNLLDNELTQNYSSYKNNKKLQALVEMLVLDVMSILGCSRDLENNFLLLDSNTPLLTGKYLRNHLAHYNDLVDLLLSDPLIAVILNANKLTSENIIRCNKKIGKLVIDSPSKLELKFNQDLFTIANQEQMFIFLQTGSLEGFKSCLSKGADINARNINLWTSIHFAAKGPNLEISKFIIEQSFNINVKDINGQTPLHIAAIYGRQDIVEFFISQGLYIEEVDKYCKTALHLAAQNGHKDTVVTLLQNKANVFATDIVGLFPLYYAVRNDHINVVHVLLEKDTNVDIYEVMGGYTPLHEAAEGGHLVIVNFLLPKGANVNAKNDRNWTPLHAAARNGYPDVLNALILKGADVNTRVINGCTALHYSAETGHEDIVNILLKNGATINVSNETGEVPLHFAVRHGHVNIFNILLSNNNANITNNQGMTSLHFAAQNNHFQIVVALLAYNVDINVKNNSGYTSLHHAVERGHIKITELLMKHKALVNVKTSEGFTALHIATSKGYQDIVNLLIENKADIHAKAKEGLTPLHTTVVNGNTDIINFLIKSKADINARSTVGYTPLHLAVIKGQKDVVNFLLKNKAKVNSKNATNLTPLHDAVLYGHNDIAEVLIKNKADLNAKDDRNAAPIHIASESGNKDIVRILITNGAEVNIKTINNHTPIILAVKHNYVEIVEMFITNQVEANLYGEALLAAVYAGFVYIVEVFLKHNAFINAKYEENMTLLHVAAWKGHKEIVNQLLAKGANINVLDVHKETPLYFAAREGYVEIVEIMMAKGGSIDAINDEGFTPLHAAAAKGHINVVKLLLDKSERNLNLKDYQNRTPVELAVAYGHLLVVKTLLEYKQMDINSRGNGGYTILHIAAQENKLDIVKYLLDNGAYINAENSSGTKPIHIAAREGNKDVVEFFLAKGCTINDLGANNQNLLFYAAMKGHLELLKYLIAQGADVNSTDINMLKPIHIAAYFGYNDIIKVLLKNGAVCNALDKNNRKPLNMTTKNDTKSLLASTEELFDAVKCNSILKVKNLIKAGGYVNSKDFDGRTLLHYAAQKGYYEIVQILLQNKADVNAVNNKGYTPLHYAAQFSYLQVVKALLCNGAIYNAVCDIGKTSLDVAIDKSIVSLLELVNESFKSVENENLKVINNLNKIKDIDTVKAIMNARNIDNRSLVVSAVHNNFKKVEDLKGILQGDVSSKINTALRMLSQDNYQGSLNIFKSVLQRRKEILGSDNPGSLDIQSHIAKILFQQGSYKDALNMLEEIFQKQKEMLGSNGEDTLSTRGTIAFVLHTQGRDKEALDIYQDVYMWQKRILGQNHTDTLETQLHMALVLDRLEKYEEALSMNQEVYKKRKESNHPAALLAQNNMAMVLSHQQNYKEALKVYQEVLRKKKVILGMHNSSTLKTLHNIAGVLFCQKKYHESLKAYQEVLNIRKNILGPYHPDTLTTQYEIGNLLFTQSKWNSALKAYNEGLEQRKAIWGLNHPITLDILNNIEAIKFNIKMEGGKISENLENAQTNIYKAASKGDIQTIQKLLNNGAEINEKDTNGRTLLHYAVDNRHIETLIILLKNGADTTLVTDKGNTPLHIATSKGYKEGVEILLQNVNYDELNNFINAQTFAGGTAALHVAAKNGFQQIVISLLKHGATYNIKNKEGKAPVDLSKDQNVINLLKLVDELFVDANKGNYKIIDKLKVLNQDVLLAATNARNMNQNTILQVSITCMHKSISRGILELLKNIG